MQQVLLGFGSNLGDRRQTLRSAWNAIRETPDIQALRISDFLETEPVGGPEGQPDFLNAVGLILTVLKPTELLDVLQQIERTFGRERREHWGPRTLDIDILLFSDRIIETPTLIVPHPEMHRRDFVLFPAMEVAPEMIHPTSGKTIRRLAEEKKAKHLRLCPPPK